MASSSKRLSTNVAGDVFVDSTCIDCGTCRWMAPDTFDRAGGFSRVHTQPAGPKLHRALMALVACPTASIGTDAKHDMAPVLDAFPDPIYGPVYHLGYHAESSYGAASYLIVRDAGNIMVDSPRYASNLRRRIDALGGVKTLFLSHRDDVADHEKWTEAFGCERVMHADDQGHGTREIEQVISGDEVVEFDGDVRLIPVPGHTKGSMCLLYRERYLFTGDHLAFDRRRDHLIAFRGANWYDWSATIRSMERLREHTFEWVLPGHGAPANFDAATMQEQLETCIAWMYDAA